MSKCSVVWSESHLFLSLFFFRTVANYVVWRSILSRVTTLSRRFLYKYLDFARVRTTTTTTQHKTIQHKTTQIQHKTTKQHNNNTTTQNNTTITQQHNTLTEQHINNIKQHNNTKTTPEQRVDSSLFLFTLVWIHYRNSPRLSHTTLWLYDDSNIYYFHEVRL